MNECICTIEPVTQYTHTTNIILEIIYTNENYREFGVLPVRYLYKKNSNNVFTEKC